jgi:excisionase family DNA binding protein
MSVASATHDQGPIAGPGRILPPEFSDRSTLTVEEAAKVLRISRASAYAAANDRTLPTVKIGRRLLVPRVALERMLSGA